MIPVIVLAGGSGSRFGSNKLLTDLNGLPLVLHAPLRLKADGGFAVTLITCHEEIAKLCAEHGLSYIVSDACREGLSGSVRAAAEQLMREDASAAVFFSGDQPFLTAETIRGFYQAWQASEKGLGSCMADGRVTNPAIFSAPYFKELTVLKGDAGGRVVLRAHEPDVFFYELQDPSAAADIDLPQQLAEARKGVVKR